jgi:hypothetical protein
MLPFGRILLKHGRHFDYGNQPLNMRRGRGVIPSLAERGEQSYQRLGVWSGV